MTEFILLPDTISIVVFEGLNMALLTAGGDQDADSTEIGCTFPIDMVEIGITIADMGVGIVALGAFLFAFKY